MVFLILLAGFFPPDYRGIVEIATSRVILSRVIGDPTSPETDTVVPVPDDAEGKCKRCGGSGQIRHGDGHRTTCPECDGTGKGQQPPKPAPKPSPPPTRVVVTLPDGKEVSLEAPPKIGDSVGEWVLVKREGRRAWWRRKAKDVEVLIFSATWCGPCQRYRAVWSRSGLPVREVDIDKNPEIQRKYGVTQVPTTVVLRDGKEVSRRVGVLTLSQLRVMVPVPGSGGL